MGVPSLNDIAVEGTLNTNKKNKQLNIVRESGKVYHIGIWNECYCEVMSDSE